MRTGCGNPHRLSICTNGDHRWLILIAWHQGWHRVGTDAAEMCLRPPPPPPPHSLGITHEAGAGLLPPGLSLRARNIVGLCLRSARQSASSHLTEGGAGPLASCAAP